MDWRLFMTDKIIFYYSRKFEYIPSIFLSTMSMPKSGSNNRTSIRDCEIEPLYIILYDMEEFVQADVVFDKEDAQTIERFDNMLKTIDISRANPEKIIWTLANIIPNNKYKKNKLELYSIDNIFKMNIPKENKVMFSFCCGEKNANIFTNDTIASGFTYTDLEKIGDYEILTDNEKEMAHIKARQINAISYIQDKKPSIFTSFFGNKQKSPNSSDLSKSSLISALHLTEQEQKIFDPEMLSLSSGIPNSEQALNNLVGLDNVKEEVRKLKAKLAYRAAQKKRGITTIDGSSMHMCFTGNPGTGKTTVARIITGILYDMGYIKENKCIEVNGQNLKGGYQGQTAIITKLVLKSAKNKVLFIDEAYALFDGYQNGYGKEAVAVILKQMEDERDNTVIIFAGYKNDMDTFLLMNDGLKSRINRYIDFKNYNTEELTDILISMLKKKKLYISELALSKCIKAFKKATSTSKFSNARFVRNLIEKVEYEHAYNTHNTRDTRRQDTIEADDISDDIINELLTHSM